MKFTIAFLFITLSFLNSYAQNDYNANLIPQNLKNRANTVIRNEEMVIDMQAQNNVIHTVKQAITVLNKNGDNNARLVLFYDKNTSIKSVKGEVYNEFGKLIGKFTQSDFKDESAVHDFSLFEDSRVKHYLPNVNSYPYTVVYQYEIRYKQNLIIPDWLPKPANDVSVEKSSYTFICKPIDQIRIKVQNIAEKANEISNEKQKILNWKVNNLTSQKNEPFSPNRETYQPRVKIAATQFSYYNYSGTYTNWQELGKWYYNSLLKNRNNLPPETIQFIKNLVKDEKSEIEKAKKIYHYLQEKTRYISVQIGIGGFQPFTAAEVNRLGYGDCKALVNYMQSLLAIVGIDSYYCVVQAGNEKTSLDTTFASMNQGNHIILCLPLKTDTIWLECTNQQIPFGYLGTFTDDRYVLACTSEGGKLLKTPKLAIENNLQIRKAKLTVSNQGDLSGSVETIFSGSQYNNPINIIGKPFLQQQKLLKKVYDINQINFDKINYLQKKNYRPETIENIALNVKNYAALNNDKLFLALNPFNIEPTIQEVKNREMPVYINRGYTNIDSNIYQLPANFTDTMLPSDKVINCEFGSYVSSVKLLDNELIYIRKFVLNEGNFSAESYAAFSKFIIDVNQADHQKLIFNLKK